MLEREYLRDDVLEYAYEWAYKRNPAYYDFYRLGGDCTNFVSQCIYAGSKIMNYTSYDEYIRSILGYPDMRMNTNMNMNPFDNMSPYSDINKRTIR